MLIWSCGIGGGESTIKNNYMETRKMKIEYRKLTDNESDPWLLLTNIDELIWNGVYALRVIDDDGSLGLPFRFENDDTVTLVLKDHSHEGKLQNGRTVVQTITRVERSSGKVFTYTRTRYCVDGKHRWNTWERAADSEGGAVIDSTGLLQMVGDGLAVGADGKITIADNAVDDKRLSAGLKHRIDVLVINSGMTLNFGRLVEFEEPDKTSRTRVYSEKIYSNGETITANAGYKIQSYKVWDEVQELFYETNLNADSYFMEDIGYFFEIEFVKEDGNAFTAEEFPLVIKSFVRTNVVWDATKRMDSFVAQGDYHISGVRSKTSDGLPMAGGGAFNARLTVLTSGNCITQKLTLLNVSGGSSNVYIRHRQNEEWGLWKELLTEIPNKSVTENKLGADVNARIDTIARKASLADTLVMNADIALNYGRLVEFEEPDKTLNNRVYSEKIYSNGETITANAGYKIQSYKVWDEVQELFYETDLNADSYFLQDIGCFFEIEFVKEDGSAFTAEELPKVIKSFIRTPIVWDTDKRMDSFVAQGNFHISGNRTKTTDGLPTTTTGKFEARLTVLAGSETSVMQVLTLYYISTGEGNMYMRTLQGTTWSAWKSLFGA